MREFLEMAIGTLEEGIPSTGKHVVFLEGEMDHRVPVHDQSLRLTGAFKTMGRMIGNSVLHGGPGMFGLSPAVKHYLSTKEDESNMQPPPTTIEDIPEMELR